MRRGDVWAVALDPVVGSKIAKTRPAVVVSVDAANGALRTVTVVPLTHNPKPPYPNEAATPSVAPPGTSRKALAHQVRTVDKARLRGYVGRLAAAEVAALEEALRWHMGL